MMIDSGTTFSHFPSLYLRRILNALSEYCAVRPNLCGKIDQPHFKSDSCLELRQPDENYRNIKELLDSFPNIKIHLGRNSEPYVLYPKNYFYQEYLSQEEKARGIMRLCLAIKGEQEGKIILGAFSMVDYYFYFDRKARNLKIFRENCYLRTNQILRKKKRSKRRILEAISSIKERSFNYNLPMIVLLVSGTVIFFFFKRKRNFKANN